MTPLYYFEQKKFDGSYSPRTSEDMPTEKRSEGGRRDIRCVKRIETGHMHLTLTQLENNYGTDGKFSRGQGD